MPAERLTVEQCERLRGGGLPQELNVGDRYWSTLHTGEWVTLIATTSAVHLAINRDYYKIPDLEELMEFAATLSDEWMLEPTRVMGECTVTYCPQGDRTQGDYWTDVPILAVYALCEKLMEVGNGDN